jgi:hypothetical protein
MVDRAIALIRHEWILGATGKLDLRGGFSFLNVITGRGNNSKGGMAVLRPEVAKHLRNVGVLYTEGEGSVVAKIRLT